MDRVWDEVAEGVILIEGDTVTALNSAAARLLRVNREWAAGQPLFLVLRDHRLEAAWEERLTRVVELGEHFVEVRPTADGLLLREVTDAHRAHETARELLAVISHELRTPVTTIVSTLEALGYDSLSGDERKRFLSRAQAEASRLVRLLDDLTVSVDPPRQRTISLRETCERAQQILAPTLQERGIELHVGVGDALVWADPDKLLQIVINLVENAAIHGPAGQPVSIDAVAAGQWVELAVRDHGAPLDESRFDSLFEPYSGSSAGRGRGLGLYIVRRIAERWGGQVWVSHWTDDRDSSTAGGNAFHVLVPARQGGQAR